MADNVNLNDMMDKPPRITGSISFDATNPNSGVIPNEKPAAPKINEVQMPTANLNFGEMKPLDVNSVLPPREDKPSEVEENAMSELDAAIARTIAENDKLIDHAFDMYDEAIEAQDLENAKAKDQDRSVVPSNVVATESKFDPDDDLGLYDDSDEPMATSGSVFKSTVDPTPQFNFDTTTSEETDETPVIEEVVEENKEEDTTEEAVTEENPEIESPKLGQRHVNNVIDNIFNIEDEMTENDDDEPKTPNPDDEENEVDKMMEDLKSQMKNRVSPITKKFDLSKFTIAKKGIAMQKVMKNVAIKSHQNAADWVLYNEGRPISMIGLSGQEIVKLNPANSNRNRLNTMRDIYRIMYEHIEDANKPEFEMWLKKTRFADVGNIYFALYMATFGSSNFVNYICPKCNKAFIKDIRLEDMVEYKNDKVKEKVNQILRMDTTTKSADTYPVDIVQISDVYAFGIRTPSIWNVVMETASLSEDWLNKYADLIDTISYIDSIYVIDAENNNLIPIDTKPDPNDQSKTVYRRIKAFYDVIRTLSTDEFYALRGAMVKYDDTSDDITYLIPGTTCPNCAEQIPADRTITPDNMLFTHHQLVAIGNM